MTDQTPATEAGRGLWQEQPDLLRDIIAIEAEARASFDVDVLAEAVRRVETLWREKGYALALLEDVRRAILAETTP